MNPRSRSIASAALLILGLLFILAAVSIWVTGEHRGKVLGIAVSLTNWRKPWWIGAGLVVAAGLIAAERLAPWRWLGNLGARLDRVFCAGSPETPVPAALWGNWGALIGAAAGFFFALHYYYLVPLLTVRAAVVISAAAAGAILHRLYAQAMNALLARLPEAQRANLIASLYFLIWAALIAGPLGRWEARFTEPVFTQGLFALGVGLLALTWWRNRGRRGLIGALALLVLAAGWDGVNSTRAATPHDRVIFITLDTTRADHLGCYGYPRPTTPNLDRLAAQGLRFTRAFAPMGATDPSHLSMLTGWYPRTHGVRVAMSGHLPAPAPSLAETFLDHGFKTAAITSRIMLDPWRLGLTGFTDVSVPATQDTSAAEAYRRAMNWLVKNRRDDIFLWVHFFDPHQPYEAHPGNTNRFTPITDASIAGNKWMDPDDHYTPPEVQQRIDYYDGELSYMDDNLGRLLAGIASLGPSGRPALIVVMGDHGEMLGEKMAPPIAYGFGHGGVIYDEVARIPWIISWPGQIPPGKTVDAAAETVDLAPTLTQMLWNEPYKCQGHSLLTAITSNANESASLAFIQRDLAIGAIPRPFLAKDQYAVVQWPYKLFYTVDGDLELYDLAADPGENHNLINDQPDQAQRLKAEWDRWAQITPETPSENRPLTARELENLKNLGYIQ